MNQSFEKGSVVCLVLLFVFGVLFAYDTVNDFKQMDDIVAETDSRTEYLRDRVQELEARVKALEEKAVTPNTSKGTPAASPAKL